MTKQEWEKAKQCPVTADQAKAIAGLLMDQAGIAFTTERHQELMGAAVAMRKLADWLQTYDPLPSAEEIALWHFQGTTQALRLENANLKEQLGEAMELVRIASYAYLPTPIDVQRRQQAEALLAGWNGGTDVRTTG